MQDQGKISFVAAVLMSINIIVGAGIFAGPKNMALVAGNLSFLGWPLCGLLLFPIVWGIAQAARIFPGEGGFYHYCATGINKTFGFAAQWMYLLGYIGTAGTLVTALREGLVAVGFTLVAEYALFFNAIIIFTFALLNLMDITLISRIQSGATLIKMFPLFFLIAVFGWYWNPSIIESLSIDLNLLCATIPFTLFAFWGFEACCSIGHLLKGGPEKVGKIMLTAFSVSTMLYMFFHLGLIHVMGAQALAEQGGAAFPYFMNLSPLLTKFLAISIAGSILLSYANSIFGVSLSNITNLYMLARNKLIVGQQFLTQVNGKQRPTIAAFIHALIVFVLLIFISSIKAWFALTNLGICIPFFLTLVALFFTYVKQRSYLQMVFTCLGFASCGVALYYSWINIGDDTLTRLTYTSPLIFGLILGLIMFKVSQSKHKISL
jgi:basic amino acid/polyamine antiporter, APA family